MPGTISQKELAELRKTLAVSPDSYTKPVRIYCDVDGVIFPEVRSMDEVAERFPEAVVIETIPANPVWEDPLPLTRMLFWWDKGVVARLAALSHSPNVDFVWLSSWRVSAPHQLDALLGIKSVGYLPWQRKMADYAHAFKREAVLEDQKASPSDFVWIDDHANIPWGGIPHVFAEENDDFEFEYDDDLNLIGDESEAYTHLIPQDRFLSVVTSARSGLTGEELDMIEAWVAEHAG